jgi:hypothetical protein
VHEWIGREVNVNPFLRLPPERRRDELGAYLKFLRGRDGEIDGTTLVNRRRDATTVRWRGPLDRASFHRNFHRLRDEEVSPQVLWLLAAAKANRSEKYGVDISLALARRRPLSEIRHYMELEELVHTRALLDACALFGLQVEMLRPPPLHRALIWMMTRLPDPLALPVILCGEVAGAVGFALMREQIPALFGDEPDVAARLNELLTEILVDELGHVIFNRAMLGQVGLTAARLALPFVVRSLLHDMPEIARLAGGPRQFVERVVQFQLGIDGLPSGLAFAA